MADAKARLFAQLRRELQPPSGESPCLDATRELLKQFADGLHRFVPGRADLCAEMARDFDLGREGGVVEAAPRVAAKLLEWIRRLQAPVHDTVTDAMEEALGEAAQRRSRQSAEALAGGERDAYAEGFVVFLEAFYDHTEMCYREVWEARERMARGESALPPRHRPKVEGNNGVPSHLRTGGR